MFEVRLMEKSTSTDQRPGPTCRIKCPWTMGRPWSQSIKWEVSFPSDIVPLTLENDHFTVNLAVLFWRSFDVEFDCSGQKTWPHMSNSIVLNYGKALESLVDTGSLISDWYRTSHTRKRSFYGKYGCTLLKFVWCRIWLQRTRKRSFYG